MVCPSLPAYSNSKLMAFSRMVSISKCHKSTSSFLSCVCVCVHMLKCGHTKAACIWGSEDNLWCLFLCLFVFLTAFCCICRGLYLQISGGSPVSTSELTMEAVGL